MPETEQAPSGKSVEEQYKELQAEFTRRSQRLSELESQMQNGQLVEKTAYDQTIRQWANDDPENAFSYLGLREHYQAPESGGSNVPPQPEMPFGEFDDSIFDTTSEAHKKFVEEHGQKGYRQAALAKMAPELLSLTGLDKQLAELREQNQSMAERMAEQQELIDQAHRYAVSSFDQTSVLMDPRLTKVRETIERLKKDKSQWFDLVQKADKADSLQAELDALKAKATAPATPEPIVPTPASSAQPAPSPEQLATTIQYANAVPQGTAGSAGSGPSQYADPFDYAVDKALGKVA